ncbi:amino acid ABC transporter permease [Derxia gummosa]|uniref:Amino acid ABC transporter permease n=1 Tax=Derxia gummosa DSM 723 TaxID=1121388 RepID=A0A8B6X5L7_9BURK|nr:amino acid ABC transporter permease [Derxia gummosa]
MALQWDFFTEDIGDGTTYLDWMLSAWGWTAAVAGLSLLLALVVGAVVGTLRTLPSKPAQIVGTVWTELFRNIPLLVQIFVWYHVVPALIPPMKAVPGFVLVVFGLGFFTSARISEQVRSGIQALPRGQRMAGMALGLTTAQTYRHIILPMAFRIILPPLTSESMGIVKNSAAAFAVSISELTMFSMQATEETSRPIEVYLAVTGLYVVTAAVIYVVMSFIEKRVRVPGFVGPAMGGGH